MLRSLSRAALPLVVLLALGLPAGANPAGTDSDALVTLGETLFSDPRLSSTGSVSCASCHDPLRSFADGVEHSIGEQGNPVGRNSPTLVGIGAHDRFIDPLSGQFAAFFGNLGVNQIDGGTITHLEMNDNVIEVPVPTHSPVAPPEPVVPSSRVVEENPESGSTVEAIEDETPVESTLEDAQRAFEELIEHSLTEQAPSVQIHSPLTITVNPTNFADFDPFGKSAISLAERCLSPLGNALEMGSDIDATIAIFAARADLGATFDVVFGGEGGITRERVGEALAAYLRSLAVPGTAPFARFLAGEDDALDEQQKRGLALFNGKGQCASCHAGESLRDGLVHVTDPTGSRSVRLNRRLRTGMIRTETTTLGVSSGISGGQQTLERSGGRSGPLVDDDLPSQRAVRDRIANDFIVNGLGGDSGYGGLPVNLAATPTLWDVAQTAPYFGDGSAQTLEEALATHIRELGGVRAVADATPQSGESLAVGAERLKSLIETVPEELRPPEADPRDWPAPEGMTPQELADLEAFLGAFSGRAL